MSAEGGNFEDSEFQGNTIVDGLAAGNTACFSGSTTMADLSPLFDRKTNMTFAIYVKTCLDTACQGVIFTYAVKFTFAIWNRGTVVITYNDFIYDTRLSLEDDKWNQIAIVWRKLPNELDVYVYHSDGSLAGVKTLKEGNGNALPVPNPFRANGQLSLARWQPAPKDVGGHGNDSFRGCLDELRIWQK